MIQIKTKNYNGQLIIELEENKMALNLNQQLFAKDNEIVELVKSREVDTKSILELQRSIEAKTQQIQVKSRERDGIISRAKTDLTNRVARINASVFGANKQFTASVNDEMNVTVSIKIDQAVTQVVWDLELSESGSYVINSDTCSLPSDPKNQIFIMSNYQNIINLLK